MRRIGEDRNRARGNRSAPACGGGGGHCGPELALLCDQLGYDYTVVDGRAEYASRDRFPNARRVIHASPDTLGYQVDLVGFSHAVLVGWSWRNDLETLATLVDRFPGWIGIIASRTKRKEMFARLRERGVTDTQLERIVTPVGLPIGAVTPAEIAVSILGQVIATVRRQ